MDEIQEKMAGMEEEASIVKDLYELMEKYQVPVSPEDHAVYQVWGAKLGVQSPNVYCNSTCMYIL